MSGGVSIDLDRALATAIEAVETAARLELVHFTRGVAVETKDDLSPVTVADREAEAAIRAILARDWPTHGFLGEESGGSTNEELCWVVDPLDGTRGFTRGGKFWGPLVALLEAGQPIVGVMAMPALGDVYAAARGRGTTKNGKRLAVSEVAEWSLATVMLGEMKHLFGGERRDGVLSMIAGAASGRGYGDLAGLAMLLEGRAEVWLEAGVKIWDLAPLKILVEEAGGRFTDLDGRPTVASGHAVATNGRLHAAALAALKR